MMAVDVPNVPGVPSVVFALGAGEILSLLVSDALSFFGVQASQWGIYQGGAPVVLSDNVVTFAYTQDWSIADFPLERGAFETYNKVQVPFRGRFRFSSGGSEANRTALLSSVAAIAGDYNLYSIVTPEAVYTNVNIQKYDYSRAASQGMGLVTVDVDTVEVRIASGGVPLQNTQSPTSAGQVNGGSVQAVPPTPAQASQSGFIVGIGGRVAGPV